MSIERKDVRTGHQYLLDGEPVVVFKVHRLGSRESLTLANPHSPDTNPYPYLRPYPNLRAGSVPMAKFLQAAEVMPISASNSGKNSSDAPAK